MVRSKPEGSTNLLGSISIFSDLSEAALERIRQRCRWRQYKSGELIVDYLDTADDVFLITEGDARVTIYSLAGKPVSFRDLGPGDLFGEYPAIDDGPRSASVEARTDCFVASMSASSFRELLTSEPMVALKLLRKFVSTIRSLTTRVHEFSALSVNNRVQAELLRLARAVGQEHNSACIDPAPTHIEIANRISTHREAVTRELNRLARMGIIERRGNMLVVSDVDRLAAMVQSVMGE